MGCGAKDKKDAGLGSIMGALIGDALGVVLEFHEGPPTLQMVDNALTMPGGGYWGVAPGQVSDDGELTICQLQGLGEAGSYDLEKVAGWYARWIRSNPFDVGTTTKNSMGGIDRSDWKKISQTEGYAPAMTKAAAVYCLDSKANGSLMRAAPLGVMGHRYTADEIGAFAKADSSLSHPNELCGGAVAIYAMAVAGLVRGEKSEKVFGDVSSWAEKNTNDEVREWLSFAERNQKPRYYPQAGFIKIAFVEAFRHFVLGTEYLPAIRETLLGGGDTDTNSCIIGGLLGARTGFSNLPTAMKEKVLDCDTKNGTRPRPDFLHPRKVLDSLPSLFKNS